jgi:hypothetical protein
MEEVKEKFKSLRQKVNIKLRRENTVKSDSEIQENSITHTNHIKDQPLTENTSQFSRGDYMERLRTRYKVSKEKVNHNLLNIQKFYQRRLDEKESTKLKKSMVKWGLFSSYLITNYFVYSIKSNLFNFKFLFLNSTIFIFTNLAIQRKINKQYKERIKEIGMETLEKNIADTASKKF